MTDPIPPPSAGASASRKYLPVLLLLFFGSGSAALIYEIVWFQLLQLVIGSSAISLGVLLGAYMGGMCLGSVALSRILSRRWHPLRAYAVLELGIGALGLTLLFALPGISSVYVAHVGHGFAGILLRGVVGAVCLLPPTFLMGATLPAMARWTENHPQGVSWLGFFYGGNIAGAVFGCLFAGFYLLRVYDLAIATYVAAGINAIVALLGWILAARAPWTPAAQPRPSAIPPPRAPGVSGVYLSIALSGLTALGAEVVWTRLLGLILGGTVYAFSIILAVFLTGLGIGSALGSFVARATTRPRLALGCAQLLLTAAIAWTAYELACSLPFWPIDPALVTDPWLVFQLDLSRCLWAILPATILWGASFPLALAAAASPGSDPGRLVGGIYAANTIGAIIGAIGFSLIVIPVAGTQDAQRLLIGLAAFSSLVMLAPLLISRRPDSSSGFSHRLTTALGLGAALGLAAWMLRAVPPLPGGLVGYGRNLATWSALPNFLYVGEGMISSVAVSEFSDGVRNFHVSGKVEASTEPQDMRLQRMLGHIPALVHPGPRSVLIVGCGAGVTAGTFVLYPSIRRIVICEIEPLIPRVVARYFAKENYHVLDDPRLEIIYDDGRHFLLTTREKFDIITSDPIHPWVKGSAALYTQEYFELCKNHLNPGGFVTQWVPLYESNLAAVQSELRTFFEVFPEGTVWSNDQKGAGYDVVVMGQANPTPINVDDLQRRLSRSDYHDVAESLSQVGFNSVLGLLSTYAGQGSDYRLWLKDAAINRDLNLRLQYLAGLGLNDYQSENIYNAMLSNYRFPELIFSGSDNNLHALHDALAVNPVNDNPAPPQSRPAYPP
jgi:spermidine synthase